MRALKEFHIWDFPDSMYVLLDSSANKMFFRKMYSHFESRSQYSKFLNLHQTTVKEYDRRISTKKKKKYVQYIPIWVLKKSKQFLNVNEIKTIERSIEAYRPRAGKPIKNNILPVKECPALYCILGHMLGDGSATKRKQPYYSNTCKELRDEFKRDLAIFGNVEIKDRKLGIPIVVFQKAVTDFLASMFDISFDNKDHIPELVFTAPDDCKKAFLRALFDDEGTASASIAICITGQKVIEGIKYLLENMEIQTCKTMRRRTKNYELFSFQVRMKDVGNFIKFIGFSHPLKASNAQYILNRKSREKRTRSERELDSLILTFLRLNGESRTLSIANEIQLGPGHTLTHLKRLEQSTKIIGQLKGVIYSWKI